VAEREDVIAKLLKKTLYVGAFAFIMNNFSQLSGIVFRSFAGLGLTASGSDWRRAICCGLGDSRVSDRCRPTDSGSDQ